MKTSIEIEFKTLLNEEQYNSLLDLFEIRNNVFKQENYYFDTNDFYLRKNGMALRIRHKGSIFKMTLKTPFEGNLREDSILLDEETAKNYIAYGFNLKDILNVDLNVYNTAMQETFRATTPYKDGRLFIDKSNYYGKTDYELEYEVDEKEEGLKIFHEFLKENNITYSRSLHKIDRVYSKKNI